MRSLACFRPLLFLLPTLMIMTIAHAFIDSQAYSASRDHATKTTGQSAGLSPAAQTAEQYAEALVNGDYVAATKLDFACQYRMVSGTKTGLTAFPQASDPVYSTCADQLKQAHRPLLGQQERDLHILWPSKGALVFFPQEIDRYPASTLVMEELGKSPPGSGLHLAHEGSQSLPAASFRLRPGEDVVAVSTTLVRLRIRYQDPLTSPVTYAPEAFKWANPIKRPRRALKSAVVQWVVMTGLRQHGFPGDAAVLNLPVSESGRVRGVLREAIPFVTQKSQAVPESLQWWGPQDSPGLLTAGAARAATFPDLLDRVAMLNRILIIDPNQPEALTVLARDLYGALLKAASASHKLTIKDPALTVLVNEIYWNTHAQTTRTDLSLGMEMGGFSEPTPADYLYHMIPAMEILAKTRPELLDNRVHLGTAYRWNNDQRMAIETHKALVEVIPEGHVAPRSQALTELAWSRITEVAWNRRFEDPDIQQAYHNAKEALTLAINPVDKFAAAYTMAYSMLFMPTRDNNLLMEHLTEARRWYEEIPGHSAEAWEFLLGTEQLKAVLDADPQFKPLLASAAPKRD